MNTRTFYSFSITFFVTTFAVSFWEPVVVGLIIVAVMGVCVLSMPRRRTQVIACAAAAGIACISFLLTNQEITTTVPIGISITLSGFVCSEMDVRVSTIKFCFDSPELSGQRVLVTSPLYPQYMYGERLQITGTIVYPTEIVTDSGRTFDYPAYLAKEGITFLMNRPQIQPLYGFAGNRVKSFLFGIKQKFITHIQILFPEPESSLLAGVLIGDSSGFSPEIIDMFTRTGLVHILVLSGSNVTIVAETLMRSFSFFPVAIARLLGTLSIVLFAIMTGAGATTVRATCMALIVVLVKSVGRRYDVSRALIIAAFCMTLENPRIVAFDTSFQLSFLATLALIYIAPLVKERLGSVPEIFGLRDILATTIGTQILTTPLILYIAGKTSLISLIPNILVLPTIPFIMLGGFVSTMLSFIAEVFALPFAWITSLMLWYIIKIVTYFGSISFALIHITTSIYVLVVMYSVICLVTITLWQKRNDSQQ